MSGFLLRALISAIGLWVASALVPGMQIDGAANFILAGILLGAVNALVRPVVILLTLPATVLSLGLFLLVINAAMLALVAALLDGFVLQGFGSALLGSLLVSVVSWIVSVNIGASGRFEVLVFRPPR